ncbi:MAG TPA: hypothetical protein VN281_05205 [Verrucomicrobiae bacterium]|jgi:hypothetical protein|nr:hypothetical protein [Verrucomicrobiae bacterium]
MSPQLLQLLVFGIQEAIKAEPALVADFETLFNGDPPTDADFDTLRTKVAGESYSQFVPQSAIPALNAAATAAHTTPAPTTEASGS